MINSTADNVRGPVPSSEAGAGCRALLDALGSAEWLAAGSHAGSSGRVLDARAAAESLLHGRIVCVEWPAIVQAYSHVIRNEARELIACDLSFKNVEALAPAAKMSRHFGRLHLRRLRPLRDHRLLNRYREAVESGEAQGWHFIVFAIILGTYSLPLRQGMLSYARQSLAPWVSADGEANQGISAGEKAAMNLDRMLAGVVPRLNALLTPG